MTRYFFHVHNGELHRDEVGTELPDLDAVRREVTRSLPAIACDEIPRHGDLQVYHMHVMDKDGCAVYSATLSYAAQSLSG